MKKPITIIVDTDDKRELLYEIVEQAIFDKQRELFASQDRKAGKQLSYLNELLWELHNGKRWNDGTNG